MGLLNKNKTKSTSVRDIDYYRSLGVFDTVQLIQIKDGIKKGLTPEQIEFYAKPEFDYIKMNQIRLDFEAGFLMDQIEVYAKPNITHWEMYEIRRKIFNIS